MNNQVFETPLISVIIPCKNEITHIEKCILSLINQINIPGEIEILVIDGNSTDGTKKILESLSENYKNLKVVNNPKQITPVALNLGIKASRGKYICILGAHAEYSDEFISSSLNLMNDHPEASCVGGPIVSKGKTAFGKSTAIAMSSFIGVGNAKHRFPNYEGFAEMACFPVFRREVFDRIGMYDEALIKNQDDELCFRLKRDGGKVFISPIVKSIYYVRDDPVSLFKQYFDYGFWRAAVLKKHKIPIAIRQFAPSTFFFVMLVTFVLGVILEMFWIAILLPGLYIITLLTIGLVYSYNKGFLISKYIPLSIFILHFSYAIGFVWGIIKFNFGAEKFRG